MSLQHGSDSAIAPASGQTHALSPQGTTLLPQHRFEATREDLSHAVYISSSSHNEAACLSTPLGYNHGLRPRGHRVDSVGPRPHTFVNKMAKALTDHRNISREALGLTLIQRLHGSCAHRIRCHLNRLCHRWQPQIDLHGCCECPKPRWVIARKVRASSICFRLSLMSSCIV